MNGKKFSHKLSYEALIKQGGCSASTAVWLKIDQLTKQLKALYNTHQFNVLSEAWQSPLPLEVEFLNGEPGQSMWIRSSRHVVDGQSVIYARVIAPSGTFEKHREALLRLKERTIGDALLFHRQNVTRGPFVYFLAEHCPELSTLGWKDFDAAYVRVSVFDWAGVPLLITEIFSSAFLQGPCPIMDTESAS